MEDTIEEEVLTDVTSFHAVGQGASKSVSGETDTQRSELRNVKRALSLTRIASFPSIFPIEGGAAIFTFVVIAINVMNKKQMTEYILKHYYGMSVYNTFRKIL